MTTQLGQLLELAFHTGVPRILSEGTQMASVVFDAKHTTPKSMPTPVLSMRFRIGLALNTL